MKSLIVKNARYLIFAYIVILFISIYVVDIYSYGGYVEVFFLFIALLYNTKNKNIRNIVITSVLFLPVFIYTKTGLVSFVADFSSALLILTLIDLAEVVSLRKKQVQIIMQCLYFYFFLFVLFIFEPSFYDSSDNRYRGLLPSATVSSSVLVVLIIFSIEYHNQKGKGKMFFFTALALIIVNLVLCKTRSVLLIFPYFIYQFYKKTNKNLKHVSLLLTLLLVLYGINLIINNADFLRLSSDDSSFLTRTSLYEVQFAGIRQNYFIIPHGSGACIDIIKHITSDEFSPHNSFLQYWYDWGISWLFFLIVLWRKINFFGEKYNCKIHILLIMIFVSSCALHNILLYSYIWIPVMLIMILFKDKAQLS